MLKKVKNKAFCAALVLVTVLLSSVCFCALNWSYIIECSHALEEVRIGLFQQKGLSCFGTTNVEPGNYAGVSVVLKTLDEDGDWVTVTGWEDTGRSEAAIDVEYPVSEGTYKLKLTHKAYLPNDLETPVEMHYSETATVVVD